MQAKLLFIGIPNPVAAPVIQMTNGEKAIITSIRISNTQTNNRVYEIHHSRNGETAATASNAIAFNVTQNSKTVSEFLVHPIPISPGEALWLSSSGVTIAVYGITL
jgi:hypothetical protein